MQPKITITGGRGFLGQAITKALLDRGYKVQFLSRHQDDAAAIPVYRWDEKTASLDMESLAGIEVLINLAGAPIADKRWSSSYKRKIRDSRVNITRALAKAIAEEVHKPQLVIQASAIGYYGLAIQGMVDESTPAGKGFLAETCQDWEEAIKPVNSMSRLVYMRLGLVLGRSGGALPRLKNIYQWCLGAQLGSGEQWSNWVHVDDVVAFVLQAIGDERFQGPYNLVAPRNVSNRDFHEELCQWTPSLPQCRAPAFAVRALLGQQAELVLFGPHVIGHRLEKKGFIFKYPELHAAIENLWGLD